MPVSHEQLIALLLQVAVFGLVFALWIIAVILWYLLHARRTRRLNRRLGLDTADQDDDPRVLRIWRDGEIAQTTVPGLVHRTLWDRLEQLRDDAGWHASLPAILIGLGGAMILVAAVVQIITGNLVTVLGGMALVVVVFWTWLQHCVSRTAATFDRQFLDALDLTARSLRAGHPLSGAMALAAEEIPAPVGTLFGEIQDSQSLGVSMEQALNEAATRSRNADMKVFAAAVIIQLHSGGNLADMMERVAWVIRERMRLNRRARVLTTEAQFSKRVLLALPLGMFVLLNLMNPTYMAPMFTTPIGNLLLAICMGGLLLGAWLMNKMAVLRY
ncbi:MAG: type II secretion system F family protein [Phycisphaeraceae bacterium]